jgi:molybdopterin/thiamine biosynthesis adenylyltransferase
MNYKEILRESLENLFGVIEIVGIPVDEKSYHCGVETKLLIQEWRIDVSIKVPLNWETNLIEIYIDNYKDIPFLAHLDSIGKLCTFDMEGIMWGLSFRQTCDVCLRKMIHIVKHNGTEEILDEVETEFESYWALLPHAKLAKVIFDVNDILVSSEIYFYLSNKNKKGSFNENRGRKEDSNIIYVSNKDTHFILIKLYPDVGTKQTAILINCNSKERVLPPDWRKSISIEYINNLMEDYGSDSEVPEYLIGHRNQYNIIFRIPRKNGSDIIIGVILKNYSYSVKKKFFGLKNSTIIPLHVKSVSQKKLIQRGGIVNSISEMRTLVIGCGSIGGYFVDNLIKIGVSDITLIDSDRLDENNVYRHLLGYEFINRNKAYALKEYFKRNLPFTNIADIQYGFEYAFHNGMLFLDEFDMIISAVGNQNFNLFLNKVINESGIETPVLYLWNEILGIGSHAFLGLSNKRGCLKCIFQTNSDGYLENKSSYAKPNQAFTKQLQGCGSSFIPYGALTSIKTATIGIELLLEFLEGNINESVLRSMKGDSKAFIDQGYKLSNAYTNQATIIEDVSAQDFVRRECEICRKKTNQ